MSSLIISPYPHFTDVDGTPLEDGYVYIGEPNFQPQANPKAAYWDPELTVPAAQPIRTKGGYASNSGTPGRLYIDGTYSILVQDKRTEFIYSQLDAIDYFNSPSGGLVFKVDTIAELRAIAPTETGLQASLGGYTTLGDGEVGPLYYWDNTSSEVDNGFSVIKPTVTVGNGRWLWVNTNTPVKKETIAVSGVITPEFFRYQYILDTSGGPVVISSIGDGKYIGQKISVITIGAELGSVQAFTGKVTTVDIPVSAGYSLELEWDGVKWLWPNFNTQVVKEVIDASGVIEPGYSNYVYTLDTTLGAVVISTIEDGEFIGQKLTVITDGTGQGSVQAFTGKLPAGDIPITDGLALHLEWDGVKWVAVNEYTADYVSGNYTIQQYANGIVLIFGYLSSITITDSIGSLYRSGDITFTLPITLAVAPEDITGSPKYVDSYSMFGPLMATSSTGAVVIRYFSAVTGGLVIPRVKINGVY